ncbi:MAG: uroporphyrinogen-III synthase [Acidobacteria bacterium]|nr:uroporphyrinogen-III synthase [Acidobacteriota bacterium]
MSEMLSLAGKRILITRTRQQASGLAAQLEAIGAHPIVIPTIEIAPPQSYAVLDDAIQRLDTFDWLLFTSANAVEVFARRSELADLTLASPRKPIVAVIGPATARAVEKIGLAVAIIPPRFVAESLAEALSQQVAGCRVLLVRAEEARDILPEALTHAGATVTIAPAYRNLIPDSSIGELQVLFADSSVYPDAITFTSASTARNLAALLQHASVSLPANIVLASIGPITSEAMREAGYMPAVEANESTIPALIQALSDHFDRKT